MTGLIQMHWQFPKDKYRTEFVAQKEISSHQELQDWSNKINEKHPLPEGAIWLWCKEGASKFIMTEPNY